MHSILTDVDSTEERIESLISEYKKRKIKVSDFVKETLVNIEMSKWMLHRLETEQPCSAVCHDWNLYRNDFSSHVDKMVSAYMSAKRAKSYGSQSLRKLLMAIHDSSSSAAHVQSLLVNNEYYKAVNCPPAH